MEEDGAVWDDKDKVLSEPQAVAEVQAEIATAPGHAVVPNPLAVPERVPYHPCLNSEIQMTRVMLRMCVSGVD